MIHRKTLKRLPLSVKNLAEHVYGAVPARFRYGKAFWDTYSFLQESQWWSREKLEDYQMEQLSILLRHAYENVPYYRRVFDERSLKPRDIQNITDLRKLPYLTKDIFKHHMSDLVARNADSKDLLISCTSGTTGKPLQFYEDSISKKKELAFIYHQWSRVGVKPFDPLLQLRGALLGSSKLTQYDPIRKILRFSPIIRNKSVVLHYLERMENFGAEYLHGYPSAIFFFASMIKKFGFSVPFKFNAVLLASESIYPWQRKIIQEVFNCRIFSHYGQAEKVSLAAECENDSNYHCVPQYGVCEIREGQNEIVGTSFLNYTNPFIRYRTTDVAISPGGSDCRYCGRAYYPIFSEIEGRLEDIIITSEGARISPAVMTHPFKSLKTVNNAQIIQKSLDKILLKVVCWKDSREEELEKELKKLRIGLREICGPNMEIDTEIVDFIQTSKTGKFQWIKSEISEDFFKFV